MKVYVLSLLIIVCSSFQADLSGNEIVKRSEKNLRAASVVAKMRVNIQRPRWKKEMMIKAWIKGTDYAAAYILAPASDSGTVFLKNKDEIWNYLPGIKKTIKMPMNILSQQWMGTDLTNDDLINGSVYSEDYRAKVIGSVEYNGLDCYNLELLPEADAEIIWSRIELYVDKTHFIQMHARFFDEDFEMVHSISGSQVKKMGGRTLATKYIMKPGDNPGYQTVVTYESLQFDQAISDSFFAKSNIANIKP